MTKKKGSVIAAFLFLMGIVIIILTVYEAITWEGSASLHDYLFFLLSFSAGITEIAVSALINMHAK